MRVFNNIISKKEQEKIKDVLYGRNFPWYYVPDITINNNEHQSRPGHSHVFYTEGKQNSDYVDIIKKISENVNKKIKKQLTMYQVRSFLQLPLNEKLILKYKKHKEDTPHIDINKPHTVFCIM